MPRDLCATGDFFGFYGAEIVFPIAKSTENGAEMREKSPAAPLCRCSQSTILSCNLSYNSISYTSGLGSFAGLGDGLAAGDGILLPGADFFIVYTLIRRLPKD